MQEKQRLRRFFKNRKKNQMLRGKEDGMKDNMRKRTRPLRQFKKRGMLIKRKFR